MNESLKFTVFSDLHYKKHMYAASIADHLEPIIERAHSSGSDFILHAGDLCNDYNGSKELTNSLLKNKYSLPVYGVYGNHELETRGNTMEVVTPLLTNRTVSFGTPDGRFSSEIGYYHFDIKGFRIICTDTNYSQLNGEWVHNLPASWGPPNGAENQNALSPKQLDWLESTLNDAADKGLKCIVVSHAEFSGKHPGGSSSDHKAVRELFRRVNSKRKTVVLAINGHYHTDHLFEEDGIYYFDCNTVQNGFWLPSNGQHYTPGQTFDFEDFDGDGNSLGHSKQDLCTLSQSKNTWFFTKPLSAVITISGNSIIIEGAKTDWTYGIVPEMLRAGKMPCISSHELRIS